MKTIVKVVLLFWATLALSSTTAANFQIVGSTIFDPGGKEFIPMGVNVQGMKWVWPGDPATQADLIANAWKFNIVRVNCKLEDGFWNGQNVSANAPYQTLESMETLVEAFTSQKVVVMLDFHDRTGSYYSGNDLENLKEAWREVCDRWGNNPYVWFNIMNEPGGSTPKLPEWVSMHREVIKVIRDEKKNDNIIVVDAHFWGQDIGEWNSNLVPENRSSVLTNGNDLINFNEKTYNNIMFSIHFYDQWNQGSTQQVEHKMHDYFTRVKAKGFALMIGEYGTNSNSGDLYFPGVVKAAIKVGTAHGIGLIWWHWYGGDASKLTKTGNGNGAFIDNQTNPTNLTWPGQLIWDRSHYAENFAPFISIIQPTQNQILTEGAKLVVNAIAADHDSGIDKVRIFNNDLLVQELSKSPFTVTIENLQPGRYSFKALAIDKAGKETLSEPVIVIVNPSSSKGNLLFITGTSALSNSDDALFNQMLKSGYKVVHKIQNEVKVTDATNRAGVIISSSATLASVGSMFVNAKVPVLVANPSFYGSMKMTGSDNKIDFGTIPDQQQVSVKNGVTHIIAQGFSDPITVYANKATIGFGIPGSNSEVLLTAKDDAAKAVLFTYKNGVEMVGLTAPSVRIGWFGLADTSVHLTPDAMLLFEKTIDWMVQNITSSKQLRSNSGEKFWLGQNYPNPFSNSTTIEYTLSVAERVKLSVYNVEGKVVEVLVNENLAPGNYQTQFSPDRRYQPGIYVYKLDCNEKSIVKQMIVK